MVSLPSDEQLSIELQNHRQETAPTNETNGGDHPPSSRWLMDSPPPPTLWKKLVSSVKRNVLPNGKTNKSGKNRKTNVKDASFKCLKSIFPIFSWGRNYKASMFKNDLMAGLTLASLSIPQSIGYAKLAKLDPQYGLYTSFVPPLVYALMGNSREIAIGPVAVVSLLISSMVGKLQDPHSDPAAYRKLVFTVTLFAGTFQALFGLCRLGFLVDFLSHAALVGFMAGAAIIIGLQQLKGLLNLSHFTTNTDIVSVLRSVYRSIHDPWYPLNIVIGCSFLIFLVAARIIGKKYRRLFWVPAIAPLLSVILSTLIVFLSEADHKGVQIVGHIKKGLNPSSVHHMQLTSPHLWEIVKMGFISAIIALTEALAVGRSFAAIKGYRLDGNKEMTAMGCMNIVGSLTSCYVATGSFSRTTVNVTAGCESVISNVVMAITVMLSLEVITRLLYYTPTTILASIILSALPGIIDIPAAIHIWKLDKLDFLVLVATFFGVIFASVEIGLIIALAISFARILLNSIKPGIEGLGRLPRTDTFCNIGQFPMAVKTPGVLTLRISSTVLCFANANFIREKILRWVSEEENNETNDTVKGKGKVQAVIIDMSCLASVDTSGLIALHELHKDLESFGTRLAIANPRWEVLQKLRLGKFEEKVGFAGIFLTVSEAVDACLLPVQLSPCLSSNC